jgi:acyl-CoA reductase-like NAD-dependent aldehyde dehydrogenase
MDTYPVLIGGIKRKTEEVTDVRFPFTGEVYARVCQAGAADIEDAIAAAVTGFETMRKLSSFERSKILDRLADQIGQRADELVHAMVMEGGKTK